MSTEGVERSRMKVINQALKRTLLALAIIGIGATSSGCLWVRDDQGHHHWWWHHEHDDHPDHHEDAP